MTNDNRESLDLTDNPALGSLLTPSHAEQFKREKIKILFDSLLIGATGALICATIVYLGLSSISNIALLKTWFITVVCITVYRYFLIILYKLFPNYLKLFMALFISATVLISACWGIISSIMMPEQDYLAQMIIVIIIAGTTAGAIQTLQASLFSTILYVSLSILPLCIWLYLQSGPHYITLSLAMTLYYVFMLMSAFRANKLLNHALELKFFNNNLIDELSKSNIVLRQNYITQKHHENDMTIINKMNSSLQICKTSKEAYDIITICGQSIFANLNGSLTVSDSNRNQQVVAEWGMSPRLTPSFPSDNCWALRSGNQYDCKEHGAELICEHYLATPTGNTICIPLITQNNEIGMLNFNLPKDAKHSKHLHQIIIVFSDVIKLALANIKLQEKLQKEATHDPLTNLYNRRYLDETLKRELAGVERNNKTLCVAMLDIDFFKSFNDTLGHEAGDEVLKHIAKILIHKTRGNDIACRFGGEEFMLIFDGTTIEKVMPRLERIREEIKSENIYFNDTLLKKITISIGVAEAPLHGTTADEIIQAADKALYQAKDTGRDKTVAAT